MKTLDHLHSTQFACLVKGSRLTTREQELLRSVEKTNRRNYSLNLFNPLHRESAAGAVALGCPIFYGFANFYVLAAHPHQASLERINRAKGRPPLQVGSITTVQEHIPDHLTSMAENGKHTTQLIASGYQCPSNQFLQSTLAQVKENYLFITSPNISSHITGQEEPAHYEMKHIQRAFEHQQGILMMRHPNEEEARARYPQYAPMSTSIIGFYELHMDDRKTWLIAPEQHSRSAQRFWVWICAGAKSSNQISPTGLFSKSRYHASCDAHSGMNSNRF